MSREALSDELAELLPRIASGDEAALGHLYDLTLGHVFAVSRRIMGNLQATEDVVAEVYLQIMAPGSRLQPDPWCTPGLVADHLSQPGLGLSAAKTKDRNTL